MNDDWDSLGGTGCGRWRAVLAFLFMGALAWLVSGIVVS